jgi:hypothetical protein
VAHKTILLAVGGLLPSGRKQSGTGVTFSGLIRELVDKINGGYKKYLKVLVRTGTRTQNLLLRRQAPYPLGHTDAHNSHDGVHLYINFFHVHQLVLTRYSSLHVSLTRTASYRNRLRRDWNAAPFEFAQRFSVRLNYKSEDRKLVREDRHAETACG